MALLAALFLTLLQDKGESVSFRTVDKHLTSGFQVPLEKFVTTEKEWVELWAERQEPQAPKRPHPAVDFDKEVVVVAALGAKPGAGYTVEISRIVKTKDEIRIYLRKTAPAEALKTGQPTSPCVLVRMAKPDRFVRFLDEEKK
jgi:hypothetical protein